MSNQPTDFNDLSFIEGIGAVLEDVNLATPANEELEEQAWPEPSMPGVLSVPDVPCSILPGVWGEMAQAVSDCTKTPSVMAVLTSIGVLATLLQGRYELDAGTHKEILAFWSVSVSAG